jgi:hypothetical protein
MRRDRSLLFAADAVGEKVEQHVVRRAAEHTKGVVARRKDRRKLRVSAAAVSFPVSPDFGLGSDFRF